MLRTASANVRLSHRDERWGRGVALLSADELARDRSTVRRGVGVRRGAGRERGARRERGAPHFLVRARLRVLFEVADVEAAVVDEVIRAEPIGTPRRGKRRRRRVGRVRRARLAPSRSRLAFHWRRWSGCRTTREGTAHDPLHRLRQIFRDEVGVRREQLIDDRELARRLERGSTSRSAPASTGSRCMPRREWAGSMPGRARRSSSTCSARHRPRACDTGTRWLGTDGASAPLLTTRSRWTCIRYRCCRDWRHRCLRRGGTRFASGGPGKCEQGAARASCRSRRSRSPKRRARGSQSAMAVATGRWGGQL